MKVRNEADESVVIDIEGTIGWDEKADWPTIKQTLVDIATKAQKKLVVNIHSFGGFLDAGLMIHDALRMTKAEVTTRAFSFVASAATVIAQAGDSRQMSKNALYLIHKSSAIACGNSNQIGVVVQDLKTFDERLIDLYANRGKIDKEVVKGLMEENDGTGRWLSADEALQYGLIDKILEPSKAAAHFDPEFLTKYNLPQIPKEMLEKINKNSELPECVIPGGKRKVLGKITDFLKSLGFEIGSNDKPEDKEPELVIETPAVKPVAEPVNADPTPAIDPIPEIPLVEVPEEPEQKIETNPEADILKLENVRLQKEVEDLKVSLGEAESKLAKAGAQSTKPGGVIAREDPDNTLTESQKSWNEDTKKLVEMFTFANTVKTNKKPKE
jgi:ATP-dependent protease ClpP protease subunit